MLGIDWLSKHKHMLNACIKEVTQHHEDVYKYLQTHSYANNRLYANTVQSLLCDILFKRLSELFGETREGLNVHMYLGVHSVSVPVSDHLVCTQFVFRFQSLKQ